MLPNLNLAGFLGFHFFVFLNKELSFFSMMKTVKSFYFFFGLCYTLCVGLTKTLHLFFCCRNPVVYKSVSACPKFAWCYKCDFHPFTIWSKMNLGSVDVSLSFFCFLFLFLSYLPPCLLLFLSLSVSFSSKRLFCVCAYFLYVLN